MVNEQARHYEHKERVTSLGLARDNRNHRKKQSIILNELTVSRGARVLEVGCGHGLHASRYADRYEYHGVDLSGELLDTARQGGEGAFYRADARTLPWPDDHFNAVVGAAILHHVNDQAAALREWVRVASEQVVLMEPNYLFPTAFASAHLLPEERHKTTMAPWRLWRLLADLPGDWRVHPRLFTPPWPERLASVFDGVDAVARRLPVLRWSGQMLLLHGSL